MLKGNETPGQSLTPPTGNIWKMLKNGQTPAKIEGTSRGMHLRPTVTDAVRL